MTEATLRAIDMASLQIAAGAAIAGTLGVEDGFVVGCAAAGLVVAGAAAISRGDPAIAASLPDEAPARRDIVLQTGHDCDFGAPVSQMLRMGGARPIRVGSVNACSAALLDASIGERTAAILHVVSYEASATGMVALADMAGIARTRGVPLIVDCAGQVDIRPFIAQGGDLFIQSVQKYLQGPTAGILAGTATMVAACRALSGGIARPMKASREQVSGTIAALHRRAAEAEPENSHNATLAVIARLLAGVPGLQATPWRYSPPVQGILLRVDVDPQAFGMDAAGLVTTLAQGTPPVMVRADLVSNGAVLIHPLCLDQGAVERLAYAIRRAGPTPDHCPKERQE